ncbi:hypothetical protein [Streptosporangium roseum]|uniref:hypothetical protein n=1 Tax=Streptosporangium roseum TaxID=2001 RepID=UPI0004CCDFCB|nr:hypothetical protein [Streptosporangium roseum]
MWAVLIAVALMLAQVFAPLGMDDAGLTAARVIARIRPTASRTLRSAVADSGSIDSIRVNNADR